MKKHLLLAAMLLTATASVGTFSACTNDDLKPTEQNSKVEASTVMSIQFALQLPKSNRATVADDKQNQPNPEFNHVGTWVGSDIIKSVDVYIFKEDAAAPGGYTLEKTENLDASKVDFQQPKFGTTSNEAFIRPKKAFQVTPGAKRVFVVVNPTAETKAHLTAATNDFTAFAELYNGVITFKNGATAAPTKYTQAEAATAAGHQDDPFTIADHIAKLDDSGANQKDLIVMTGAYGEINVQDNVSESATLNTSAPVNRAHVTVQRAVARVLVTSDKESYEIKGDNPTTEAVESEEAGNAVVLATISNLTYVVAQGESSLYLNQQESGDQAYAYKTPNSAYKSTEENYDATVYGKYDYTGLWRKKDNHFGGYSVPTNAQYEALAAAGDKAELLKNVLSKVKNTEGLHGEFFLPNTHALNADRAQSGYRKGNTAYVLVRGKINPKFVWTGANQVVTDWETSANKDNDLFLGDDGKFYSSAALAQDPTTNGNATAQGMKVKKFVGGKVLYFVWVNPDNTNATEWVNSPAIRNNIYHIQISGIKNYVYNWNPLVPNPNNPIDPLKPVGPDNPRDPNNPNNPDPQPFVPTDPNDPTKPNKPDPNEPPTPINPEQPLSLKEAWMSVDVTILPWQVHTFKLILQ